MNLNINDASSNINLIAKLQGGLGNQMFQIASCLGIAREQNLIFNVSTLGYINSHSQVNYFSNIFRKIKIFNKQHTNTFHEPNNMFSSKINMPKFCCDTLLFGYFQNEKYFSKFRNEILDLFEIENDRYLYLHSKYNFLHNGFFIHYRRGDYVNNPCYDILFNYYDNCFEKLKDSNYHFYILSDDIEYCKNNISLQNFIKNKEYHYLENENELNSLYLMSLCKNGGIGANSTFSWWGGYLNNNPDKIVFYPKKWYHNTDIIDVWWDGSILL